LNETTDSSYFSKSLARLCFELFYSSLKKYDFDFLGEVALILPDPKECADPNFIGLFNSFCFQSLLPSLISRLVFDIASPIAALPILRFGETNELCLCFGGLLQPGGKSLDYLS